MTKFALPMYSGAATLFVDHCMSRPEYKTNFERALECFRKGEGDKTAALCREALARRPDDIDFLKSRVI